MRSGATCTLCAERRSVLPALRYRCYRGTFAATLPIAASIAVHRSAHTFTRHVDACIALTQFQRNFFVRRGLLQAERVHVRPNFMPGSPRAMDWDQRDARVIFVGRLADDKGVDVLLAAWKLWGADAPPLLVIGEGPRRRVLERIAKDQIRDGKIAFVGQRPPAETHALMRAARMIVVPSRAFEGFPMVIREAMAFGVPLVASDVGALANIVSDAGCGAVFAAGDAAALAHAASMLWDDEQRLRRVASTAVEVYRKLYSEEVAYGALLEIYKAAIAHRGADATVARDAASR
jgi:glycosyltransferase involved in cell wall biosynthesis